MKFVRDDEGSPWLRDFIGDLDNFDWDGGNEAKNANHGVRREEIESIFYQEKFIFAGRITEPAHAERIGERRLYAASIQEH